MSAFHLLSLPHLPLIHVLKQMTIENLINLSFEQEDIQDFLKKIPIRSGGYKISLDEDGFSVRMNNQDFSFQRYHSDKSVLFDALDNGYGYIQKIFPGGINQLEISPLFFSNHLDRIPKECDILTIGKESEFDDCNIDYIEECPDDLINSLIDQTEFKSGLKLDGLMKTENSKMFNVDYLKVYNSGWMTSSTLERLRNRIIRLEYSTLFDSEIKELLKNLKDGTGNDRLEVMTIDKEDGWNMDFILDGLDAKLIEKQMYEMEKKTRKHAEDFLPYYTGQPITLHNAHEFTKIDGRRVSVELVESTLPSSLRIFVWPKEESSRKRGSEEEVYGTFSKKYRADF